MMKSELQAEKAPYNHGLDTLRVLCMMMVPMLHMLGDGGVINAASPMSGQYVTGRLMQAMCLCAVNCFGMISGYVGYGRKHPISSLLMRVAQALFYTLPATLVFFILRRDMVHLNDIGRAFIPFSYPSAYWYFNAYFALFFFMPYLDQLVARLPRPEMTKLLLTLLLVFSVLSTIFHGDIGQSNFGYSSLWLAVLYLIGAYFAKYGAGFLKKNSNHLWLYIVSVLLILLLALGSQFIFNKLGSDHFDWQLLYYTTPLVFTCALGLFLFFANLRCGKALLQFNRIFAPVTFGVYLFHEEPLIKQAFFSDSLVSLAALPPLSMALAVIGIVLGIWLTGSALDWVRVGLFKLLRLRELCAAIDHRLCRWAASFTNAFLSRL